MNIFKNLFFVLIVSFFLFSLCACKATGTESGKAETSVISSATEPASDKTETSDESSSYDGTNSDEGAIYLPEVP